MFFHKKFANSLKKEWIEPTNEKVYNENPIKRIIDGKLYDTSKANKIYKFRMYRENIPNCELPFERLCSEDVTIYKGNCEWFIEYQTCITPVSKEWVMDILARRNTDKYIELFGEVEEA